MASKTIIVSDLSGEQALDPAKVLIIYEDGSRIELDVNSSEVEELAAKGRKRARRGRPRKKASDE